MKRIGIIGAGRFGLSLAESLAEAGQEVLLLERNGSLVQKARDIVSEAVQGDATQLNQLAHILIDNAVKYAADDSTVTILLKRAGEKIRFSVNNKGSVIAREDMEHLFDRFYRAEKSRTTKGYGLGLSIAQRIVESMNGRIAVESNETEGTTFTVILSSSK